LDLRGKIPAISSFARRADLEKYLQNPTLSAALIDNFDQADAVNQFPDCREPA
jgi:hypothetical protein